MELRSRQLRASSVRRTGLPHITHFELDAIDHEVIERLPGAWGAPPSGTWPVNREQALLRLREFLDDGLPVFGPHEDAMLSAEWKLAHSTLSSSLDLGLLHPAEVAEGSERLYREGSNPKKRTGPDACPFTTLYWDFMARNEDYLASDHRMGRQLAGMRRLTDLDDVRARAADVLRALEDGQL